MKAVHTYKPMEQISIQITKNVRVSGKAYSPGAVVTVQRTDGHYLIATGDAIPAPTPAPVETRATKTRKSRKAKPAE